MASPAASGPGPGAAGVGAGPRPLEGSLLILAAISLALANFIVVLDMTVANVSVPHISGGLGVSVSQGTWTITTYSVAEAICVPLTGFLVKKFGTLRMFLMALTGFGIFSTLCGLAPSLSMLVVFRLGQGFAGGPLMPLTQTMLLTIFPKEKQPMAMALWAMTTITAPIVGPILGGWISDHSTWRWIFFINIPVVAVCFTGVYALLRPYDGGREHGVKIDAVGLGIMITWVGALQVMLDKGQELDWFHSPFITACAIVAAIGFVSFLLWELTERDPIVDISVFRHRGFTGSFATMIFAFGTFFATVVVVPQWLQQSMGYTATQAGFAIGANGVLAVAVTPLVPRLLKRVDARVLVFCGVMWLGAMSFLRCYWTTDSTFLQIVLPQLLQGPGMTFFFVPITIIGLGSVEPRETASAAGIINFGRSLAAAVGTSLYTTLWSGLGRSDQTEIAGSLNDPGGIVTKLEHMGMSPAASLGALGQQVAGQATMLATEHVFQIGTVLFVLAAFSVWLAPPARGSAPVATH